MSLTMIRFLCPHCSKKSKADADWVGRQVRCSRCGFSFAVPLPPEEVLEVDPRPEVWPVPDRQTLAAVEAVQDRDTLAAGEIKKLRELIKRIVAWTITIAICVLVVWRCQVAEREIKQKALDVGRHIDRLRGIGD